tara:strand:- start:1490 stop:1669 length:180 start_codon:yes stop_codon:yes gene_type:complete
MNAIEIMNIFEEFMKRRFPNEPRGSSYWCEWEDRFLKGAENYMDKESLRIYEEILKNGR